MAIENLIPGFATQYAVASQFQSTYETVYFLVDMGPPPFLLYTITPPDNC